MQKPQWLTRLHCFLTDHDWWSEEHDVLDLRVEKPGQEDNTYWKVTRHMLCHRCTAEYEGKDVRRRMTMLEKKGKHLIVRDRRSLDEPLPEF